MIRQLKNKPHIIPKGILRNYANNKQNGKISIYCIKERRFSSWYPSSDGFTIESGWDNHTEDSDNKKIEEPYILLAKKILLGQKKLSKKEHQLISDFHSLLIYRSHRKSYKQEWEYPKSLAIPNLIDQETRINAELNGYNLFYGESVPNRIQGRILREVFKLQKHREQENKEEKHWLIIKSDNISFITPDMFFDNVLMAPISPDYCFIEFEFAKYLFNFSIITDQKIDFWQASLRDTANLNKIVVDNALEYFFSRDLKSALSILRL